MMMMMIIIIIIMSATWSTAPPRIKTFFFEILVIIHRKTQRHIVKVPTLLSICSEVIDALSKGADGIDLQFVRAELGKTRLEVSVTYFTLTARNLSGGSEKNH